MKKNRVSTVNNSEYEFAALRQENAEQKETICKLTAEISVLKRYIFGSSSEKSKGNIETLPANQLSLFEHFDSANTVDLSSDQNSDTEEPETEQSKNKNKRGRRKIAANIPTEEKIIEAPAEMKVDKNGEPLAFLGYERTGKLNITPARVERIVYLREKWGYQDSRDSVNTALMPPMIIPRGKLTNEAILTIAIEKFFNGMPLYRQLKKYNAMYADLSKSTLSDAMLALADLFTPVADAIRLDVFASKFVHADETRLKFAEKTQDKDGKKSQKYKQGYIFIYQNADQAWFHYGDSRAARHIKCALNIDDEERVFIGYLMTDAYAGYGEHKGIRLACWTHVRRKFFNLADNNANAKEILDLINALYKVEKKARSKAAKENLDSSAYLEYLAELRQAESKPIIQKINEKLTLFESISTPSSALGKAMSYTRKLWQSLQVYLDDPELPIDNNAAERSLRNVVVGRKNWLFSGSFDAAKAAAVCYSLMESCRLQGIDPWEYMNRATAILLEKNGEIDFSTVTPMALAPSIRPMPSNL